MEKHQLRHLDKDTSSTRYFVNKLRKEPLQKLETAVLLSGLLAIILTSVTISLNQYFNEYRTLLGWINKGILVLLIAVFSGIILLVRRNRIAVEAKNAALGTRILEKTARLAESMALNNAIVESAVEGIITVNQLGIVQSINTAIEKMFGYSRQEVIGHNVSLLMPSPFRERHDDYISHYIASGVGKVIGSPGRDIVGMRKDGSVFPIEITLSEVRLENQRIFTGILRDVTERKKAELRFNLQYEIARIIGESAAIPEAMPKILLAICRNLRWDISVLWLADKTSNLLRCAELYHDPGVQLADFVTATRQMAIAPGVRLPGEVWSHGKPMWLQDVTQDAGFKRAFAAAKGSIRSGMAFAVVSDNQRLGVIEVFSHAVQPGDSALLQTMIALGSQIGQFIARKRTETELKESEQKYRDLFENASDLIQSLDSDGRIVYVNRAWRETMGYSEEETWQLTIRDFIHPQSQEHCLSTLQKVMAGEKLDKLEAVFVAKDGKKIEVEGSVSCRFVDGKAISTRGIFRDVTQRKKVDRMKDEFVSVVSHELRTPLTSIRGSLGLLIHGIAGAISQQAKELLVIALNNSERLIRLINDILDIQKIQSGQMRFSLQKTEIMPLVEQALTNNNSYGEQFGVHFSITERCAGVQVSVDSDRFLQVLTNLMSNAAKFSPRGSTVEIGVSRRESWVRVTVTDHGCGIPEEFRSRIFEKFAQADSSDTRQKGGSGLGLSICKAIVEKMNGRIDYVSQLNVGTSFYFELPGED